MRLSIVSKANGTPVQAMVGTPDDLRVDVSDRAANGEGFPGEHVVRLPRRLGRVRPGEPPRWTIQRIRVWILA